MEQPGNKRLREMGWGRARELCKRGFLENPELREAYKKYVADNQDELRTMNSTWRGVGEAKSIPSRQIH